MFALLSESLTSTISKKAIVIVLESQQRDSVGVDATVVLSSLDEVCR